MTLFNNPSVRRHLPLATSDYTEAECAEFVAVKERMWAEHGYGPVAFYIDGEFAGWGGIQPDGGEADLALVLQPDHWGAGPRICRDIIRHASELDLRSVVVLLPPTRVRTRALDRLGFRRDGEVHVHGERFIRYRLELS